MKNLVKMNCVIANGVATFEQPLMARSLVLINMKGRNSRDGVKYTAYNVLAKCRDYQDPASVIKALVKGIFALKSEVIAARGNSDCKEAQNYVSDVTGSLLGCHRVFLTDKDGHIIPESELAVKDGEGNILNDPIRTILRVSPTMPLYDSIVVYHKRWDDITVVKQVNQLAKSVAINLEFPAKCDQALLAAANDTYKVESAKFDAEAKKQAEKEAKKEAKKQAAA